MNNKLMRVLKKLYHHSNNNYDPEREVSIYKTDTLAPAEQELLHASGWVPNDLQYIRHDEIIDKLIELQTNPILSWSSVGSAFVAWGWRELPASHILAGQLPFHDTRAGASV
jgi:hypothetical protein